MHQPQPIAAFPPSRVLAGVLFALGIPWALIAWFAVVAGPGAAAGNLQKAFVRHDLSYLGRAGLLALVAWQAGWGYYLWWGGWRAIATGGRASSRRFWTMATLHHAAWVAVAGIDRTVAMTIGAYSLSVGVACAVAAMFCHAGPPRREPALADRAWPAEM